MLPLRLLPEFNAAQRDQHLLKQILVWIGLILNCLEIVKVAISQFLRYESS